MTQSRKTIRVRTVNRTMKITSKTHNLTPKNEVGFKSFFLRDNALEDMFSKRERGRERELSKRAVA